MKTQDDYDQFVIDFIEEFVKNYPDLKSEIWENDLSQEIAFCLMNLCLNDYLDILKYCDSEEALAGLQCGGSDNLYEIVRQAADFGFNADIREGIEIRLEENN